MKKQEKKYNVEFLDANRVLFNIEFEFSYQNGYKEFSMHGKGSGHSGQCQDSILPASDPQRALLALWKKYHLNGMSAGTPEQNAFLATKKQRKNDKRSHYDFAVDTLKKARLHTVKYKGKKYQYGTGWIKTALPKNIEAQIEKIIADIQAEEAKRKGARLQDLSDENLLAIIEKQTMFSGVRDMELCAAFVKMFDLSEDDLQDIKIDGNRCEVQGTDYLAGTDDEMEQEHDEYLENYINECVLGAQGKNSDPTLERYFDREAFKKDAAMDGRGHSLNRYDGGEESAEINGTTYYAYQN